MIISVLADQRKTFYCRCSTQSSFLLAASAILTFSFGEERRAFLAGRSPCHHYNPNYQIQAPKCWDDFKPEQGRGWSVWSSSIRLHLEASCWYHILFSLCSNIMFLIPPHAAASVSAVSRGFCSRGNLHRAKLCSVPHLSVTHDHWSAVIIICILVIINGPHSPLLVIVLMCCLQVPKASWEKRFVAHPSDVFSLGWWWNVSQWKRPDGQNPLPGIRILSWGEGSFGGAVAALELVLELKDWSSLRYHETL